MTHPPDSASPETKVCGNQAVSSAFSFAEKIGCSEKEFFTTVNGKITFAHELISERDALTRAQAIDECAERASYFITGVKNNTCPPDITIEILALKTPGGTA